MFYALWLMAIACVGLAILQPILKILSTRSIMTRLDAIMLRRILKKLGV
jgi:hypothetical protein